MALMAPKNTKNPNTGYAVAGLVVALIACVASGLLAIAQGIVTGAQFQLENADNLNLALQISIALFILGLAYYAIMSPDSIRRFITGRQARYGSNSLILALAFIGILFTINYLVYQNPGTPLDLTEDKSNTLSKETLQALSTLPEKVHAVAFFSAQMDTQSATETLNNYKVNSDGKFDFEFIDPDQDPLAARQAGITGDGKILLTMGTAREIASSASESELTGTLIRLISPMERVVYFLEGHGEASIEPVGGDEISFSIAKSTLEAKNYTVKGLNLLTNGGSIPADALAIIIAGPQKPITQDEMDLLENYVDGGGSLVVMEDPTQLTQFGTTPDPLSNYLTTTWGIKLNDDVVIDLENSQNPLQAFSSNYSQHAITQNLSLNYVVILPQARSITITGEKENVTQTPLILTTENSWGETELTAGEQPQFDQEKDNLGPLTLAAAGENTATTARVVVVGNSVFAADQSFDAYGNGNMFVNSVDWAAKEDSLINITPRERTTRTMLQVSNLSMIIIIILSIFVIPGTIIALGVSSWIARRRRG
jgi:ABC-type uncharacterized transport system involved in gliding motility auxiliary subunit